MRHDWIFDVLTDLRKYADKNDLRAIAAETDRMLAVARSELTEITKAEQDMAGAFPLRGDGRDKNPK